jgi:hypothetical protein
MSRKWQGYTCEDFVEDGYIRKGWPLSEVATCEYTRVKENPHQNEHFKPWMEWAFQDSGLDIIWAIWGKYLIGKLVF